MEATASPVQILLVEDSEADARLTLEAFKEGQIHNKLNVVEDGFAALNYLRGEGQFNSKERPDLILLDLNLPRKSGLEVLAEIKQDSALRHIPIIILTTSDASEDIAKAYRLNANCYITKPVDLDHFMNVVRTIEEFWLSTVQLPTQN